MASKLSSPGGIEKPAFCRTRSSPASGTTTAPSESSSPASLTQCLAPKLSPAPLLPIVRRAPADYCYSTVQSPLHCPVGHGYCSSVVRSPLHGSPLHVASAVSGPPATVQPPLGSGLMPGRRPQASAQAVRKTRPTQLQRIDDQTAVPPDVFERMMRIGSTARGTFGYSQHRLAFCESGQPVLRNRG
eukprot:gnl/TRDRNA2_/TRDRNA2_204310_c0_seq1.p1 gnl/TRDRNA2_/TRDRNA2_204310_c0~~gnl/TRDRNA2_/TRDRNA2_204310_c0_seq1.p1  ORF type:complete len:187 (-),score=6.10 gnl/TRDRNA2_/TRDRNA2_204310_c0_seq1:17-577(-)